MRRNLFLYLALTCFLVIVGIFVFDGYLGVYDSATVKTGEQTQEIEAGAWPERYSYSVSSQADQSVFFRYRIDNRRFISYPTTVNATLWQENQKLSDLVSETRDIKAFSKMTLEWTLDPAELALEQSGGQFTVRIVENGTVRDIITSFYRPETGVPGIKIIPPPARP